VGDLRINELTKTGNQGEIMGDTMTSHVSSSGMSASRRFTIRMASLLVAFAAVFAIAASMATSEASADLVGNPGTYTLSWDTDSGTGANDNGWAFSNTKMNADKFPFNAASSSNGATSFQVNIDDDGNITMASTPTFRAVAVHTSCLTGAFLCVGAPSGVKVTPQVAAGGWTGTINPITGLITMNMRSKLLSQSNSGSAIDDCSIGTDTSPIAIAPTTNDALGEAYNRSNGRARISATGFTVPLATNMAGGTPSDNCSRTTSTSWGNVGVPSTATKFRARITISNAGTFPQMPVKANFVANPNPVAIDANTTLDASGAHLPNGVQACPNEAVSDTNCGYRWDFDGDGNVDQVTNGPTVQHNYPAIGTSNPRLTIYDTLGAFDTKTVAVVSQTRPTVQIDSAQPGTTAATSKAFTFSMVSDPYGASFQCSTDNGTFTACASGDTFNFAQTDDASSTHSFRVRGINPGGVTGPAVEQTWTIDRVKPRVTIAPASKPANPTNVTSANFTFTADKAGSTLECQLDGGSWAACGTNSTGTKAYSGLGETPNPHQFRIRATDPLGNIGGDGNPGGGSYDWRVDLTAPIPTFISKPANPSNDVSPLITFSSNEPVQLAQCRLKVNGVTGPWAACDSLTSKQYTDLADNQYEIGVRTQDVAGNFSNILAHAWLLETVAPNLEITSGPALLNKRSLAQFFFNYEAGANLACQLDSRPVQDPCATGVKYAYIEEGSHLLTVTATDAATNFTTKTYSWSVKTIQPVVAIEGSSVPASSSTVNTADFVLVTANGDAECRLDGAAWAACDSDEGQSYTDLADGNHTFEVRAVDEYGNVSPIDAYSWLVATGAPQVSFTSTPDEHSRYSTAYFGFDVVSADSTVTTVCSLDGLDPFDCSDPATLVGIQDGDHSFTVTATDTAGIQGSATYDWNVKAKIPGLGFDVVPSAISASADASFQFSSDEDPDVGYECNLDGAGFVPCTSPVANNGLSQGSHAFVIRATDSVGNAAVEIYEWKVDTVAPTVSFNSRPLSSTSEVAALISFEGSEADVTFECSLDNAAFAACASPTLVKNLALGAHSFRVRATDEAGNQGAIATASWSITAPAPSGGGGSLAGGTGTTLSGTTVKSSGAKSKAKKATKKKAKKGAKKKAKTAAKKNVKKATGKR